MLMPKKIKYKKPHRIKYEKKASSGTKISFGDFGLKALKGGYITNSQLEAARVAATRYLDKNGKIWLRIFPHLSITKKSLQVPMGSGKGSPEGWVAVVKTNKILIEIGDVNEKIAFEALRLASHKLSIKTKIVNKGDEKK